MLDNLAQGRFSFVAGIGYRLKEYHAANKDWAQRGALMDRCLSVLLKAWSDQSFEYEGTLVNVTPKPHTRPHPIVFFFSLWRHDRRGRPASRPLWFTVLAADGHARISRGV